MIAAIVTDIEGTTSSIDFVHKVLFPYSAAALPEFVRSNAGQPQVAACLQQVAADSGLPEQDLEALIAQLLAWIEQDRKHTALKTLQGLIWQRGYAEGGFQAHVYPEVAPALRRWADAGLQLYVYSSGSVPAQQLLFGHTEAGDLRPLFSGYFDTTSGGKREVGSYENIAAAIGLPAQQLLFLSDVVEELDAARAAGWSTRLLQRERAAADASVNGHPCVTDFDAIDPSGIT